MSNYTPIALVNEHCACGENPFWNPNDNTVWWTDIPAGKVFCYDLNTKQHRLAYQGEQVGGFTLQADGDWLLFRVQDIAVLSADGSVRTVKEYTDPTMRRFNDVMADPAGRVLAGTIGASKDAGGLYRVDLDGTVTKLFDGTGCANGMGFSPDLQYLYWTCSTTKRIFRFRYDHDKGEVRDRITWYECTPDEGTPDGMCVDSQGHIWSARWDGSALVHLAPDASVIEKVPFPVKKVSSAFFGRHDLKSLFVTTVGGKPDTDTADGTLYELPMNVAGQKEPVSKVLL
jgi:D-xylono/L-arabinono-1,4-lactonase